MKISAGDFIFHGIPPAPDDLLLENGEIKQELCGTNDGSTEK